MPTASGKALGQIDGDDRGLADRNGDVGLLEFLESLQLCGHAIRAERQQQRAVKTFFVGNDAAIGSRIDVEDRHRDARQHAALRIGDCSFDGAVGGLRLRECGRGAGEQNPGKHQIFEHRF